MQRPTCRERISVEAEQVRTVPDWLPTTDGAGSTKGRIGYRRRMVPGKRAKQQVVRRDGTMPMQRPTCRDRRRVEGGAGTDRAGLATDSGWCGKYQELGWLPATYGTRVLRLPKVEQNGSENSKETKGTKNKESCTLWVAWSKRQGKKPPQVRP